MQRSLQDLFDATLLDNAVAVAANLRRVPVSSWARSRA